MAPRVEEFADAFDRVVTAFRAELLQAHQEVVVRLNRSGTGIGSFEGHLAQGTAAHAAHDHLLNHRSLTVPSLPGSPMDQQEEEAWLRSAEPCAADSLKSTICRDEPRHLRLPRSGKAAVEGGGDKECQVEAAGVDVSSIPSEKVAEDADVFEPYRFALWPLWAEKPKTRVDFNGSLLGCQLEAKGRKRTSKPASSESNPFEAAAYAVWLSTQNSMAPHLHFPLISPASNLVLCWNFLYLLVLMFDIFTLPLTLFLESPFNKTREHRLDGLFLFFWTFDFVLCFFVTHFKNDGLLEICHRTVVLKYAKTWMLPDLTVTCIDWILFFSPSSAEEPNFLRIGKAFVYFRTLRAMRLARARKMVQAMHLLEDATNSKYFIIGRKMFSNILMILTISHFLAGFWYMLGTHPMNGDHGWVDHYEFDITEWEYLYVTSLHWALTQFTPGSMHVQPQNLLERLYAVFVLVCGMIAFSSIISSITAAVNNLRSMSARYDQQRFTLRKFLREKNISRELVVRVTRYADNSIKPRQQGISLQNVELVPMLPPGLYMDITAEVYRPTIECHPLFKWMQTRRPLLREVCATALGDHYLSQGGVLFSSGKAADSMYFVAKGQLLYLLVSFKEGGSEQQTSVESGQCFCEASLWTAWLHQGTMCAVQDSELMKLSSAKFRAVAEEHRPDRWWLQRYAAEFVRRINEIASTPMEQEIESKDVSVTSTLSDLLVIDSAFNTLLGFTA